MAEETGEVLFKRANALKGLRMPHEDTWRDCFLLTDPVRASGFNGPMMNANEIARAVSLIFDSTGTDAKRTLSASCMSGLTPANSLWFKLKVNGQTDEDGVWLDEGSELLWENIHNANFDSEAGDCMDDLMGAGWFALYVDENQDDGGLNFEHWPISTVYVASTKTSGKINIVYRHYELTAEQAVTEFAKAGDNLPATIADAAVKEPDKKFQFWICIYPRNLSVPNARRSKNLPIASIVLSCEGKQIVRESGYHEMPVIVPRWRKIPHSHYAVGPVLDALPDIRTLNDIVKLEYANLDMAVAGMWIAEDDGILNPKTIKIGPRKVIVANSVDSMKALQPATNFQVLFTEKTALQAAIRRILLADQLQPQDGPAMTATEVHVRVDLIRQLLGPIYGRLQAEYLQPLIARCFGIAYRAGIFAPAPQTLAGRSFTVAYQSPLARAQKLEEVTAIERWVGDMAAMAPIDPTVTDVADLDEAARETGKNLGVPEKLIRTKDQVIAFRQAKQQAQQGQAQQAQSMDIAGDVQKSVGSAVANRLLPSAA